MTESELCRPTKPSKNTKLCARKSARSSLAPAGLREFEGRALNHRSAKPKCKSKNKSIAKLKPSSGAKTALFHPKKRAIRKEKSVLKILDPQKLCACDELPASSSRTAKRLRRSVITPKDKPVNSVGRG
ncbi:MAG: hypothetical protein E7493_06355 [Ruminococcus albus]|nr:hypothetical protein [Ruminococcus albus]